MKNLVKAVRRTALGIAMTALASTAAMAETWTFAHQQPADSIEGKVHQHFADLVKEYTNGEIEINVFPAAQLGQDAELLQQLQGGIIQLYAEGTGNGQAYVKEFNWVSAPFLFDSPEHWQRFMRSGAMKPYYDQFANEDNITVIGDPTVMIRGPFRVLVTKEPVANLADIQGLKLRMFNSKFHIDVWNYLGTSPIVLGWADVYEGLRNGVVSGVTAPISLVESTRFYEQAPNVARTDEFPAAISYHVNTQAWNNLSDSNREAVLKAYDEAAAMDRELVTEGLEDTLAFLKEQGVNFVELDATEFTEKLKPFYQKMVDDGELPADIWEAVQATR
ncbi:MAG: TRAP transporter substrate-binding protein [Hyphomicrobiaceae bacterium]|nr:TRAP transporter substrate-binding protein [Hyphomicrobiaceae bacterium]